MIIYDKKAGVEATPLQARKISNLDTDRGPWLIIENNMRIRQNLKPAILLLALLFHNTSSLHFFLSLKCIFAKNINLQRRTLETAKHL